MDLPFHPRLHRRPRFARARLGEVEFFISVIKVIAVIIFIILTWCIMAGAGPAGKSHGGEYWHLEGLTGGLHNGFKGLASVFVLAAFAAGGIEMVGSSNMDLVKRTSHMLTIACRSASLLGKPPCPSGLCHELSGR